MRIGVVLARILLARIARAGRLAGRLLARALARVLTGILHCSHDISFPLKAATTADWKKTDLRQRGSARSSRCHRADFAILSASDV
jgi:hypothetical protein